MKKRKISLQAVGVAAVLLMVLGAVGFARPAATGQGLTATAELEGGVLAGITAARMPEENAKVLFETLLGVKLSGYHATGDLQRLLYELRSGRADAICCPDVTAEYLLRTEDGLKRLTAPADTANGVEGGGRLEFAMALPAESEALRDEINAALSEIEEEGVLKALAVAYVEADKPLDLYEDRRGNGKKIYVGVTGTVAPLDRFDAGGVPCGYSVALLAELGKRTGYRFVAVPVTPEESFAVLRSGKVDVLFCYGTSRNTTPGEKDYLMTRGYYTMKEYAYLTLE